MEMIVIMCIKTIKYGTGDNISMLTMCFTSVEYVNSKVAVGSEGAFSRLRVRDNVDISTFLFRLIDCSAVCGDAAKCWCN